MTAPADSSVRTKVLSNGHTLCFSFLLFLFIIDCNYGSLFRKGIKIEIFTFYNNLRKN